MVRHHSPLWRGNYKGKVWVKMADVVVEHYQADDLNSDTLYFECGEKYAKLIHRTLVKDEGLGNTKLRLHIIAKIPWSKMREVMMEDPVGRRHL